MAEKTTKNVTRAYSLTGLTGPQADWLEAEKNRTGLSISSIIRLLVQNQIDGTRYYSPLSNGDNTMASNDAGGSDADQDD